jgi:hypothetical protein
MSGSAYESGHSLWRETRVVSIHRGLDLEAAVKRTDFVIEAVLKAIIIRSADA